MRKLLLTCLIVIVALAGSYATPVTGINAVSKSGQVFIIWNNLNTTGVYYILYKSATPIVYGYQLSSAQNMGYVHDSSAVNKRLSLILGTEELLKIDSAAAPLLPSQGLFVSTSPTNGSFYYAIVTSVNSSVDTTIIAGENSITTPVSETVEAPSPVWQQAIVQVKNLVQIYVQYASAITSSIYPKMTNQGSFAFNFGLALPLSAPDHPLEIRLHGGGGNFLQEMGAVFDYGCYGLGMDDWLPNAGSFSSAWFGYYELYDGYSNTNPVPDTGINISVTLQREVYTINWVEKHFAVDTNRVYLSGSSMGGSGSMWLAMYIPNKITVVGIDVPKFNLAFLNDPNPGSEFNTGSTLRYEVDTLFGNVPTDLNCDLGYNTYNFLNDGYMMYVNSNTSLPIIYAQSGKNDSLTGWAEKIPFYDSVNATNAGGFYYWDMRSHGGADLEWDALPDYLRFSTNQSYPAFANCSINNNPGNGLSTNGDSVGTINGFLNWDDSTIEDEPALWQIDLSLQNLPYKHGTLIAPDSCTVNVTPRRLQQFIVPIGDTVAWENYLNGNVVQSGSYLYTGGPITIPGVRVYLSANTLVVYNPQETTGVYLSPALNYAIQLFPNPSKGNEQLTLHVKQPVKGLTVNLISLTGQVVRTWNYSTADSTFTADYDFSDLPKSEYFLQLICDKFTTTQKLIVQ